MIYKLTFVIHIVFFSQSKHPSGCRVWEYLWFQVTFMDNGTFSQCLEEFTAQSKYAKPKGC